MGDWLLSEYCCKQREQSLQLGRSKEFVFRTFSTSDGDGASDALPSMHRRCGQPDRYQIEALCRN